MSSRRAFYRARVAVPVDPRRSTGSKSLLPAHLLQGEKKPSPVHVLHVCTPYCIAGGGQLRENSFIHARYSFSKASRSGLKYFCV